MKLVYDLPEVLKSVPDRIKLAQNLTLNDMKPNMGLKGAFGLYGSEEWWSNIYKDKMPLLYISGTIKKAYVSGQDSSSINNTVDVATDDGDSKTIGIYTIDPNDKKLFKPGKKVAIVYALDELKRQPAPDGGVNYSKIALEMAVSL